MEIKSTSLLKKEVLFKKKKVTNYHLFSLDVSLFKKRLNKAKKNFKNKIELPSVNGNLTMYRLKETFNFSPELAKKFPTITSYTAQGIEDPTCVAKISVGIDGVHILISSESHSDLYIDPYITDNTEYIVYKRTDLKEKTSDFKCKVESDNRTKGIVKKKSSIKRTNNGKLRTFRLVLACSREYAQFHLKRQNIDSSAPENVKRATVLSAMNTSMTRINGVFERDLGVKMLLVANNDKVVFLDGEADEITDANGSSSEMMKEVQRIFDVQIGNGSCDTYHKSEWGKRKTIRL